MQVNEEKAAACRMARIQRGWWQRQNVQDMHVIVSWESSHVWTIHFWTLHGIPFTFGSAHNTERSAGVRPTSNRSINKTTCLSLISLPTSNAALDSSVVYRHRRRGGGSSQASLSFTCLDSRAAGEGFVSRKKRECFQSHIWCQRGAAHSWCVGQLMFLKNGKCCE